MQQRMTNRGGGVVTDVHVTPDDGGHTLRFRAPSGVLAQIRMADPRYTEVKTGGWTELRGKAPKPVVTVNALLKLLSRILTVRCTDNVDYALALDWYKTAVECVAPQDWENTRVGDLVSRGKYLYSRRAEDVLKRKECGRELVHKLIEVINEHPLLRHVHGIIVVPGHDSKVVSFGAQVAVSVAQRMEKPFMRCEATRDFRAAAKELPPEERASALHGQFVCTEDLTGMSLLIVDDVYSSGSTVTEVARAARAAGAKHVASLCAVRTMRF